jgi:hypothetical protein
MRYQKEHKTEAVLHWLRDHEPIDVLPDLGLTPFLPAVPADVLIETDPVKSYRQYYRVHKRRFAIWPQGKTPAWFLQGLDDPSSIAVNPEEINNKAFPDLSQAMALGVEKESLGITKIDKDDMIAENKAKKMTMTTRRRVPLAKERHEAIESRRKR